MITDKIDFPSAASDERSFLVKELKEEYDRLMKEPLPELTCTLWERFFTDGNRYEYETVYFKRRKRLHICALLCMVFPENSEYLEVLRNTVFSICNEYYWGLPAHLKKADSSRDEIDLFDAETAYALSEIKYMLGSRIGGFLCGLIDNELEKRIFTPFESHGYWWDVADTNWAAVCAGSVGVAMMYQDYSRFLKNKPRFDKAMEHYLSGFGTDGACREGYAYWNYGFGYFCCYANMLREKSNGEFDYFRSERVKNIAEFLGKAVLADGSGLTFADCPFGTPEYNIGTAHFLKTVYGDCVTIPSRAKAVNGDYFRRWAYMVYAFAYYDKKHIGGKACREYRFPDAGWYLRNEKNYCFTAKAGTNGEPHNHNDIGSFTLSAEGTQLICDIGRGEYTNDYFNEHRYEHFCCNSFSHSVPIVNCAGQGTGVQFCGTASYENGFSAEIGTAYPIDGLGLRRSFSFSENGIDLTDRIDFDFESFTERFVVTVQPEIIGNTVRAGALLLEPNGKYPIGIKPMRHTSVKLIKTAMTVYCIDFELPVKTKEFRCKIRVSND